MIVAKKNAAYYHAFPAVDSSTPASFKTGLTITDTAYYKDGAGVWTALAITDTYTEIGTTGVYEITLTAAEMNHDQILIKLSATGMADDFIMLDTRAKLTDDLNDFNAATDEVITDAASRTASKADVSALATSAALTTVEGKVDSVLTDTGTTIPALLSGIGIAKNQAFPNFPFEMVLASDGKTPATGLTVTGQRSLDGGAYVAVSGTITEISNGAYQFDALAADTNGDTVKWRFSAATADDTKVEFITV